MQTLSNPLRTLAIKWEEQIFIKKSSCIVYYCMHLYHCVLIIVSLWCCRWQYNMKPGFLQSCSCVSTTVWLHHLNFNEMPGINRGCCGLFWTNPKSCILQTAFVWPLTSQHTNRPSKTNQTSSSTTERTYKWHSPVAINRWIPQWWPASKNLLSSALCGYSVPSRGLTKSEYR